MSDFSLRAILKPKLLFPLLKVNNCSPTVVILLSLPPRAHFLPESEVEPLKLEELFSSIKDAPY